MHNMNTSRVIVIIDGGVAYTINDSNVEVCILDLDNNPHIIPEDYKGFEDLVPAFIRENE